MKKHFVPACQWCGKAKFLLTDSNRSDNPDGTVPQLQVMHHKDTQEIYFVKKHFVPACQKTKVSALTFHGHKTPSYFTYSQIPMALTTVLKLFHDYR